jgi:catechol 2,3-dioxygenase-like lactoylglutathione lyase family enzyme
MRPHISIHVKNVKKSAEFYEKLFGQGPQKQTDDYAKFDLQFPALNFSMQTGGPEALSRVHHFGIEVDSPFDITQWEKRMTEAGSPGKIEGQVACCYALQDKVWFKDPDGNSWEVFHVHQQLPVLGPIQSRGACREPSESGACCAS